MRSELSEGISPDWPKRVHCTGFNLAGKDLDVKGYVTRRNAADSFASAARQRVASGHIFADGPSGAVWSPPQRASCALQHQPRRSRPWSPDNRKVRRTFHVAVFREILASAPVRPQKFPQIVRGVAKPNREDTDAETMSQIFLQRKHYECGGKKTKKKQKMLRCCVVCIWV